MNNTANSKTDKSMQANYIKRTIKFIKTLQYGEQNCIVLEITFPGKSDIFELPISKMTYTNFNELLNKFRPFKSVYDKHEYILSSYSMGVSEKIYNIYISIISGKKIYSSYKMRCSKTFVQNCKWLCEVNDFSEYYKYMQVHKNSSE